MNTATSVTDWIVGISYGVYGLVAGCAAMFRSERFEGNR